MDPLSGKESNLQHALGRHAGTVGIEKMSFPHHSHRELKLLLSRMDHTRVQAQLKFLENSNGFLHKLGKLLIEIPYNEEVSAVGLSLYKEEQGIFLSSTYSTG